MPTAYITGAAGFLGLNLAEQLRADNWDVIALVRSKSNDYLEKWGVKVVRGDLGNAGLCAATMPEQVDAVFHVAGNTSLWKQKNDQQTRDNIEGTRNMVAAALKRKAKRFIYCSSIVSFGHQPGRISEESPSTAHLSKVNYFRTKRQAELEIHWGITHGLDAVILNPANIIGPYDYGGWSRLFSLIHKGTLPGVIPPGKGSFCSAREVAKAHLSAYEKGKKGHNYLLGGHDGTFLELFQEIHKLLGKAPPRLATPAFVMNGTGKLLEWMSYVIRKEPDLTPEKAALVTEEHLCSSAKAVRELGYREVPIHIMLKDCLDWLRAENRL